MSLKTIKTKVDSYIELTEDEVTELGWKAGQRLDCKLHPDGSIEIQPWKSVDLGDICEFPREVLEMLVIESLEKDIPVNDVIVNLLKQSLELEKGDNTGDTIE